MLSVLKLILFLPVYREIKTTRKKALLTQINSYLYQIQKKKL